MQTQDWVFAFAAASSLSALGFVLFATLWLRKVRQAMSAALTESANQQIRTAARVNDAIAEIQKQQRHYEAQIEALAQAGLRLRQEIINVSTRIENGETGSSNGTNTIH